MKPGASREADRMERARENYVEIARAWCGQLAHASLPALTNLLAPDSAIHGLGVGGTVLRGPNEVAALLGRMQQLYELRDCTLSRVVVEPPSVAVQWVLRLEPGREWRTSSGEISGMTILTVDGCRVTEAFTRFGHWWV